MTKQLDPLIETLRLVLYDRRVSEDLVGIRHQGRIDDQKVSETPRPETVSRSSAGQLDENDVRLEYARPGSVPRCVYTVHLSDAFSQCLATPLHGKHSALCRQMDEAL